MRTYTRREHKMIYDLIPHSCDHAKQVCSFYEVSSFTRDVFGLLVSEALRGWLSERLSGWLLCGGQVEKDFCVVVTVNNHQLPLLQPSGSLRQLLERKHSQTVWPVYLIKDPVTNINECISLSSSTFWQSNY